MKKIIGSIGRGIEEFIIDVLGRLERNLRYLADREGFAREDLRNDLKLLKAGLLARRYAITPEEAKEVIDICESAGMNERAPEAIVICAAAGMRDPVLSAQNWAFKIFNARGENNRDLIY